MLYVGNACAEDRYAYGNKRSESKLQFEDLNAGDTGTEEDMHM